MYRYKLEEIASWATPKNGTIAIPALQRGLVWKPRQVELLWDSILRGFPIGSFLLSDYSVKGDKEAHYYLMDGQQRVNAISIGYHTVENPRSILWIDIAPDTIRWNSTRRFWVKASTSSHPWGYQNNDECLVLTAEQKREAIEKFGVLDSICEKEVSLTDVWPSLSKRPIPLYYFLLSPDSPAEVYKRCQENPGHFAYLDKNPVTEKDLDSIKYICDSIYDPNKFYVSCNVIEKSTVESETDEQSSEGHPTSLEVLFTRLNTGGSRITQDDLTYSAIKAYWPEIKDLNDKIAERYMSPSKLVMLAIRFALRTSNPTTIPPSLSIKKIRSLSRDEDAKKVKSLYGTDLESSPLLSLLNKADALLRQDGLPAYIRNSICYNSPEAFLLFLLLVEENNLPSEFIRGLILYLHWFSIRDKQKDIVDGILELSNGLVSVESVQQGISKAIANEWLISLIDPDRFAKSFSIGSRPDWTPWSVDDNSSWIALFDRIYPWDKYVPREMLLYCQRDYMNSRFITYDPARQDLWEDSNRPWDYDHIVPQEWVNGKNNMPYRWYCQKWLNCIGNIGAIPFEINREKSNRIEFDEYKNNADSLLYDARYEAIDRDNLTRDEAHARPFAELTWNRLCLIYKTIYQLIEPAISGLILYPRIKNRQVIFMAVHKMLPDSIIGFVAGDNEHPVEDSPLNWSKMWNSVGVEKDGYFACATWGIGESNEDSVEIGIRKCFSEKSTRLLEQRDNLPESLEGYEKYFDNQWWYFCKEVKVDNTLTAELIADYIQKLLSEIGKN